MTTQDTPLLHTEGLRLDPLRTTDAGQMLSVLASDELYRYTGGEPPTRAELDRRYAAQTAGSLEPGECWHNWIIRTVAGDAVGFVQATVAGTTADVAWLVGPDTQGRGYAREAARTMSGWLTSTGVRSLTARIHPDHTASQHVALAIGLHPSGDSDDDGEEIWTSAPDDLDHDPPDGHSSSV